MAQADEAGGATRRAAAAQVLNSGLLNALKDKFQVRLYRLGDHWIASKRLDQLTASTPATHIGDGLKQVVADAASLPIGAVVLVSDGADNSGGVDLETISEIRRQRIPIHTIGFGREKAAQRHGDQRRADACARAARFATVRQVSFHQTGYAGPEGQDHGQGRREDPGAARIIVLKDDGEEQSETCSSTPAPPA